MRTERWLRAEIEADRDTADRIWALITTPEPDPQPKQRRPTADLDGDPAASPPVPPHAAVRRSVRGHGDTKTERSRRTLGLPAASVQALRA